jgi:hypothetical protein
MDEVLRHLNVLWGAGDTRDRGRAGDQPSFQANQIDLAIEIADFTGISAFDSGFAEVVDCDSEAFDRERAH